MGIENKRSPVPLLWGQKNGKGVEGDDVTGPQPARETPVKEPPAEKTSEPKGR